MAVVEEDLPTHLLKNNLSSSYLIDGYEDMGCNYLYHCCIKATLFQEDLFLG